jgi:hypothetical protein
MLQSVQSSTFLRTPTSSLATLGAFWLSSTSQLPSFASTLKNDKSSTSLVSVSSNKTFSSTLHSALRSSPTNLNRTSPLRLRQSGSGVSDNLDNASGSITSTPTRSSLSLAPQPSTSATSQLAVKSEVASSLSPISRSLLPGQGLGDMHGQKFGNSLEAMFIVFRKSIPEVILNQSGFDASFYMHEKRGGIPFVLGKSKVLLNLIL